MGVEFRITEDKAKEIKMNENIAASLAIIVGIAIIVFLFWKSWKESEERKRKLATMTPEEIEAEEKAKKGIPQSVSCPFCKGNKIDVRNPITALGWVFIIIGLFFIPFWGLGLILILIGILVREKKYYCSDCDRAF